MHDKFISMTNVYEQTLSADKDHATWSIKIQEVDLEFTLFLSLLFKMFFYVIRLMCVHSVFHLTAKVTYLWL